MYDATLRDGGMDDVDLTRNNSNHAVQQFPHAVATFVIHDGGANTTSEISMHQSRFTVGRLPTCDLSISAPTLSRHQFTLHYGNGRLFAEEGGGTGNRPSNPTAIGPDQSNLVRLEPNVRIQLAVGDRINVGTFGRLWILVNNVHQLEDHHHPADLPPTLIEPTIVEDPVDTPINTNASHTSGLAHTAEKIAHIPLGQGATPLADTLIVDATLPLDSVVKAHEEHTPPVAAHPETAQTGHTGSSTESYADSITPPPPVARIPNQHLAVSSTTIASTTDLPSSDSTLMPAASVQPSAVNQAVESVVEPTVPSIDASTQDPVVAKELMLQSGSVDAPQKAPTDIDATMQYSFIDESVAVPLRSEDDEKTVDDERVATDVENDNDMPTDPAQKADEVMNVTVEDELFPEDTPTVSSLPAGAQSVVMADVEKEHPQDEKPSGESDTESSIASPPPSRKVTTATSPEKTQGDEDLKPIIVKRSEGPCSRRGTNQSIEQSGSLKRKRDDTAATPAAGEEVETDDDVEVVAMVDRCKKDDAPPADALPVELGGEGDSEAVINLTRSSTGSKSARSSGLLKRVSTESKKTPEPPKRVARKESTTTAKAAAKTPAKTAPKAAAVAKTPAKTARKLNPESSAKASPAPKRTPSQKAPAAVWQFKSDLRLKDANENAWTDYPADDSKRIEEAFGKFKPPNRGKEMKLSKTYGIHFKDKVQFRYDDRDRQRPVRRVEKGKAKK